jgi:mono/diheme cytochrome c family protein
MQTNKRSPGMRQQSNTAYKQFLFAALLAGLACGSAVVNASDARSGKALYEKNCVSCHGASGDGKGPATRDMDRNPRSFVTAEFKFDTDADWQRGSDADVANVISMGAQPYGGSPLMPAWGQALSEEDIASLVAYIRSLEEQR